MSATLIDGKTIASEITERIKSKVSALSTENRTVPGLAVIQVGENPASDIYVGRKVKKCEELGIYSERHKLAETTTEQDLLSLITSLNSNPKIHGILIQLPLPAHINSFTAQQAVDPAKDVDGFHPINLGRLLLGNPSVVSATPRGIMTLVHSVHSSIEGMHAVVIGRGTIVGKPVAQLLLSANATVTICHSKTKNLPEVTKQADILVVAVGKPGTVTGMHVKEGATVIDVGINRMPDGTIVGDVDFEKVKEVAGYITPVPGGVGPMTIASLMQNTWDAYRRS